VPFNRLLLITGSRFLLFSFFTFYALIYVSDYTTKGVMIVLSALYISLSLIAHFYPWKLKTINNYFDYVFVVPLAILSREPVAVLSLMIPPLYSFPKDLLPFTISAISSIAFLWLNLGPKGLLFSLLVLAFGLSPSSIELMRSLQKERKYITKLKDSYNALQKDLLSLEREKIERERLSNIIKLLDKDTPEEYLRGVKEMFGLKAVKVIALDGDVKEEVLTDQSGLALLVPVRLEHGKALVVFYLDHPAQLMDESLKENLIRCARLLSLYISGFESSLSKEQVKIAV